MCLEDMKRKLISKKSIAIVTTILIVITVVVLNFYEILYRVSPKLYVGLAVRNTVKDISIVWEPISKGYACTEIELKLEQLKINGKEYKKIEGITAGITFSLDKNSDKYLLVGEAGVGKIPMYTARLFGDVNGVKGRCPLLFMGTKEFTWQQISAELGIHKSLYDYLSYDYNYYMDEVIEALKEADISLVDKEQRKFYVLMSENNPLPVSYAYVYVNEKNVLSRIENDAITINFSINKEGIVVIEEIVINCKIKDFDIECYMSGKIYDNTSELKEVEY